MFSGIIPFWVLEVFIFFDAFFNTQSKYIIMESIMSDIKTLAMRVIDAIPEIVEKNPELAFRMFEILKRYFVPMEMFREYLRKIDNIDKKVTKIENDVAELKRDVANLKDDVAELKRDVARLDKSMSDVKVTLERLMLSLEDEAREYVKYWLEKHNISIEPRIEVICNMEINLFGVTDRYVLIGDATVRVGPKVVEWIYNRAKKIAKCFPKYKNKEFIITIYAMHFTPDAIKKAEDLNVWLIKANKEITKLKTIQIR